MTTATKAVATKSTAKPAPSQKAPDAIALLTADHQGVDDLFDEYEKTRSPAKKKRLVAQICTDLTVHAQIEEEIFYPAVRLALKDKALVPEAAVEHASIKSIIAQVEGAEPDGEEFEAKITVLHEYVKHHVKEEQNEMFPKAKSSNVDLAELGAKLSQRKTELLAARA
jgi:hemerythrin superfamily protein